MMTKGDKKIIEELTASIGLTPGTTSRTMSPGTPGEVMGKGKDDMTSLLNDMDKAELRTMLGN